MKKFVFVFALILGLTVSAAAQEKQLKKRDASEKLTPAQRNELHLKKMTLELDLNASQQKQMVAIIAEQSAEREARMAERKAKGETKKSLTSDEKFAMKSKMLDKKMETKAKMKKILNEEQMKKWEANQEKRNNHGRKMRKHQKPEGKVEVSE